MEVLVLFILMNIIEMLSILLKSFKQRMVMLIMYIMDKKERLELELLIMIIIILLLKHLEL